MKAVRILAVVFAFLFVASAQAEIYFSPVLSYTTGSAEDQNTDPTTKVSTSSTSVDARLGYLMPGGIMIGGIYSMENGTSKVNSSETKTSASRFGASVGFKMSSFILMGHYFLSASADSKDSDGTTKYTGGSGMQVDAGWAFDIGSGIGFGPQLSWYSMTYTKKKLPSGTESSKNYVVSGIQPALLFWFAF